MGLLDKVKLKIEGPAINATQEIVFDFLINQSVPQLNDPKSFAGNIGEALKISGKLETLVSEIKIANSDKTNKIVTYQYQGGLMPRWTDNMQVTILSANDHSASWIKCRVINSIRNPGGTPWDYPSQYVQALVHGLIYKKFGTTTLTKLDE